MIKNPYASVSQNVFLDKRAENIIKKARSFGIDIYENKHLAHKLLDEKQIEFKNREEIFDFFIWILNQEKKTQMSG